MEACSCNVRFCTDDVPFYSSRALVVFFLIASRMLRMTMASHTRGMPGCRHLKGQYLSWMQVVGVASGGFCFKSS